VIGTLWSPQLMHYINGIYYHIQVKVGNAITVIMYLFQQAYFPVTERFFRRNHSRIISRFKPLFFMFICMLEQHPKLRAVDRLLKKSNDNALLCTLRTRGCRRGFANVSKLFGAASVLYLYILVHRFVLEGARVAKRRFCASFIKIENYATSYA